MAGFYGRSRALLLLGRQIEVDCWVKRLKITKPALLDEFGNSAPWVFQSAPKAKTQGYEDFERKGACFVLAARVHLKLVSQPCGIFLISGCTGERGKGCLHVNGGYLRAVHNLRFRVCRSVANTGPDAGFPSAFQSSRTALTSSDCIGCGAFRPSFARWIRLAE
jgi:hypothetical protein